MVKIRILAVATMCAIVALATITPHGSAANVVSAAVEPQIGPGFALPGSNTSADQAGKFPTVATTDHTIHMVANTNQTAQYWTMQDTASSANGPTILGSTNGDTDYTESVITAGSDGTLYGAWIDQQKGINLKRKPAGSDWEPSRRIYSTGSFMAYLDIAISSSGQLFIVWNQDKLYRYDTSTDGGLNWSGSRVLSSKTPYNTVFIASGGNNITAAAFGGNDAHAYVAVWNGSSFDTFDITPFRGSSDFFGSAKPAVAPNGTIYVAFRRAAGGLYYTERQSDGSWPVSRLASGEVFGAPGIAADSQNNLHLAWSGNASGSWRLYYAFKPVTGDWQGPLRNDNISASLVANVDMATTIGARAYSHNVLEAFNGNSQSVRYQQFSGVGGPPVPTAKPVLDSGLPATRNSVVAVGFTDVTGSPDSVRYHWDAAPTDADAWVTFTNPLPNISGPSGVTADACQTHTLYTQVRAGVTVGDAVHDSEDFDIGVQGAVTIQNRHLTGLSAIYDLTTSDVFTGPDSNGASDGDPNYTRESSFDLGINGVADCSGLNTYAIQGSESGTVTNNIRHRAPALPGGSKIGPHDISIQVQDKLGNPRTWQKTLIYDPADTDPRPTITNTFGLPVLGIGGNVIADNAHSIIQSLSFQGITVTDNLYGQQPNLPLLPSGKRFWGVWIANTTSPTINVDDPSLNWYPVQVPTPGNSFTVKWDLFTGLNFTSNLRNKTGDYYVFVRFLDGAGNASTNFIKSDKITLTAGYDIPTQSLPQITR